MPRNKKSRRKEIQRARKLESQKELARMDRRWPGTRRTDLGMVSVDMAPLLQGIALLSGKWKP